jgi:hypothetical protein
LLQSRIAWLCYNGIQTDKQARWLNRWESHSIPNDGNIFRSCLGQSAASIALIFVFTARQFKLDEGMSGIYLLSLQIVRNIRSGDMHIVKAISQQGVLIPGALFPG